MRAKQTRYRGFSLLEMMIALAILMVVVGVAVQGLVQMQHRNFAETSKTDTVQQTRDFVDQMVRDMHAVGYPPRSVFVGKPVRHRCRVACSLISYSPKIVYEAIWTARGPCIGFGSNSGTAVRLSLCSATKVVSKASLPAVPTCR
jgi:prepilin-type N-terminal cleavage/methylation domain-containing protein